MPTGEPPPGYQLGLDLALPRTATPPGYALGLEFVRGPLPPRPDPSALRPGGDLPAPTVGFGGQLHAAYHTNDAAVRPGGALPLAAVGIAGHLTASYDSNVQRPLAHACAAPYQQASRLGASPLAAVFDRARQAALQVRDVVQQAQTVAAGTQGRSQQAQPLDARVQSRAQQAQPLRQRGVSAFESAQPLRHAVQDHTQQAQRLQQAALAYAWQIADWRHRTHLERYEQAGIQRHMGLRAPPALPVPIGWPGWRIALEFAPQFTVPRTWAELQTGPLVSANGLAAHLARPASAGRYQDAQKPGPAIIKTPWPPEGGGWPDPDPDPEPPPAGWVIPLLEVYMSVHSLSAVLLPGLEPVALLDATIESDDGGFGWSLTATGPEHLLDQLAPGAGGLPAQVRVSVDGHDWVFAIERIARTRRFGQHRCTVQGRSVTALLGAPYMQAQNWLNGIDLTAQQAVVAALEYTGTTVDWQLTDWLLPAGAWSFSGTPLQAAMRVAEAAGGVLRSHATDAELIFAPSYPTLPWQWGEVSADLQLPAAIITTDSLEPDPRAAANQVYVSGQALGVLGQVRRAGTAGDLLAPQVVDPLITHADAARQRGRTVLAATGNKLQHTMTLPFLTGDAGPGPVLPGWLLQVDDVDAAWRGLVRSLRITASLPTVRQTVQVERTAAV